MKIDHIHIENFIGARAVSVATAAQVQLFAGRNGAGKSSIRDAVALALTADLGRVTLKKDAAQLITTGAGSAACEVQTSDGDTYGVAITAAGKMACTFNAAALKAERDNVLPYVLDAQRFAGLDATERRAFLFGLMDVKLDGASVSAKLAERGCDVDKIKRIAPMLRAGFPAAADDARAQATAAKGAWRAITAETYGAVKAATWKAPALTFSQQNLDAALQALAAVDKSIGTAQASIGALQSIADTVAAARVKLVGLKDAAAQLVRRQVKLQHDEKALKEAQDALDSAVAKAGNAPRVGLVHDLARSVDALLQLGGVDRDSVVGIDAENALAGYAEQHGRLNAAMGDRESRAKLPDLTDARDLLTSAVRNSMRDVKTAEQAAAEVKVFEEQITACSADGAPDLDQARQHLATAQAERKTCAAAVDQHRAAKAAAEGAAQKTAQALKHHADVEAWDKIAAALAPDGIPGELLSAALGPINERLALSALDAQWPVVVVGADMALTIGSRAYQLASESEQYRADAMMAEAVAHISGYRLLVLDRFDVLDLQGRADLIAWLDVLADNGEIETALIFGTLKALPAGLPATFEAHWIDAGVCAEEAPALAEAA